MDRHLITVDELRAAGALDVPEAWRKSLRVERDLISGLFADEDAEPEDPQPAAIDSDDEAAPDEQSAAASKKAGQRLGQRSPAGFSRFGHWNGGHGRQK